MAEKISTTERAITTVEAPYTHILSSKELWNSNRMPNLDVLRDHLFHEGRLGKGDVMELLARAGEVLQKEPNLIYVPAPVVVCGDIHGQFYDLLKLLEVGGKPGDARYLFLGDYVDRGCFSCECVFYLFALKLWYPEKFFLLRGNHECRHMTDYFNFKDECKFKYDLDIYDAFMDSFDMFPLAAIVNKQFICIHAGISDDIQTVRAKLDDITAINRFQETPSTGPMCDLLWADPIETYDNMDDKTTFVPNEVRGCSFFYGYQAMCRFLDSNQLLCCIRAHEVQNSGYRMYRKHSQSGFPTLITLFSAPNYCDAYENQAAVLKYDGSVMNIKQYNAIGHPYYLPNFVDVFTWSTPFVAEKVTEIFCTLVTMGGSDSDEYEGMTEERKRQVKAKIRAVMRLSKMFKVLRVERENILTLKQLLPNNKLPPGMLAGGAEAIQDAITTYDKARLADRMNERRPPLSPRSEREQRT